jgi:hypothetical protein
MRWHLLLSLFWLLCFFIRSWLCANISKVQNKSYWCVTKKNFLFLLSKMRIHWSKTTIKLLASYYLALGASKTGSCCLEHRCNPRRFVCCSWSFDNVARDLLQCISVHTLWNNRKLFRLVQERKDLCGTNPSNIECLPSIHWTLYLFLVFITFVLGVIHISHYQSQISSNYTDGMTHANESCQGSCVSSCLT